MKKVLTLALFLLAPAAARAAGPYWDVKASTAPNTATLGYNVALKGPKPWRDVQAYGAVCDGSTDDGTAIAAAISAASAGEVVFIPPSSGGCKITAPIAMKGGIALVGAGKTKSMIITSSNVAMLDYDTTAANLTYNEVADLALVNESNGSSSYGIKVHGTNASHGLQYSSFDNLSIRGNYYGIALVGQHDWTRMTHNDIQGEPSSAVNFGLYITSTGTGVQFNDNRVIVPSPSSTTYCMYVRGPNFGDYTMNGNQFYGGYRAGYFESTSPNAYSNQITAIGNKVDGLYLTGTPHAFELKGVRSSVFAFNADAYQYNVLEDTACQHNIVGMNYGAGISLDTTTLLNANFTDHRSVFPTLVAGSTVPVGGGPLTVHTATNLNLNVSTSSAVGSALALNFVDDLNTTNIIAEYRASKHIFNAGAVGIGVGTPTALLHLPAGTATAATAPLKFTSGTNLTSAEAGAVEWNGTNLFVTQTSGPTRKTLAFTDSNITGTAAGLSATLAVGSGGTNSATALSGSSIMVSNGSAIIQGAAGTTTTLLHGNASGTPTYSAVSLSADVTGTLSGSSVSGGTFGAVNGSALTSLTAANITGTNTLPDGVLSTNVPLLNAANTWTKPQTISTATAGAFVVNSTNLVVNGATSRVGVGIAPIAGVMQIKAATDQDLLISGAVSLGNAIALNAINDSNGANIPLEIRSSLTNFSAGSVGIGVSPTSQLHTSGSVRFANFGAGAATFDANGNISSVSDARMKDVQGNFTKGLAAVLQLQPKNYKWKASTGFDTVNVYTGFVAQDVLTAIPEAVWKNKDGFYSFQDRPVEAALVNAVKELSKKVDDLTARIAALEKNK